MISVAYVSFVVLVLNKSDMRVLKFSDQMLATKRARKRSALVQCKGSEDEKPACHVVDRLVPRARVVGLSAH